MERQIAIDRTNCLTGVPPGLLGTGQIADEIERIAADALAWRAEASDSSEMAITVGRNRSSRLRLSSNVYLTVF